MTQWVDEQNEKTNLLKQIESLKMLANGLVEFIEIYTDRLGPSQREKLLEIKKNIGQFGDPDAKV